MASTGPAEGIVPQTRSITDDKVVIKLKAVGSAKLLKRDKFKVSASNAFSHVVAFLRKQLHLAPADALFVYVDKFAPPPDANVGKLFLAYGDVKYLVIHYCNNPAFG
ncbi:hyosophorin [Thecamonas trahens ATCC 50062]|uniref:Ubiquitin-like protein ATG12 n=1 Tax=Thecamonas trahens ATCC 50062 TaxID=461836 RepID=A0A0L0DSP8_THETB|nr:hyosophorin [Thecamonas trahens ATCC 50062]KNC55056.1 hyosophorin [Thecamonas trahens ATCC 50062]|eukprot:XP_013753360.1 hyosophorin [Thecamonas trahens ATCC 50062]